jgi:hypothetical protein
MQLTQACNRFGAGKIKQGSIENVIVNFRKAFKGYNVLSILPAQPLEFIVGSQEFPDKASLFLCKCF